MKHIRRSLSRQPARKTPELEAFLKRSLPRQVQPGGIWSRQTIR